MKKKYGIAELILGTIAATGGGMATLVEIFADPYGSVNRVWGVSYKSKKFTKNSKEPLNKQVAYNAVSRLRKQGLLEKVERKGKTYYKITALGEKRIRFFNFNFSEEKWDGQWWVVIFDIPEEKHKLRRYLREVLWRNGFRQVQKSVWASPVENFDEVNEFLGEFKLWEYVWCFRARALQDDQTIINRFLRGGS